MLTTMDADQIKALLTRRDREWEEALRAGFPDYNPPLVPSMVAEWAKGIHEAQNAEVASAYEDADTDD